MISRIGQNKSIFGAPFLKQQKDGGAAEAFASAVIADGGTVESPACVKAIFDQFKALELVGINQAETYRDAVVADGGTVESFSCTRNLFIHLIEIDLL